MDPLLRLTMRLLLWLRHPPSRPHLIAILAALALAMAVVVLEAIFGWPEWLTPDRGGRIIR
ncbi:MAG: hypothetical protein RMK64_10220 [Rhodovarius sp.]|nr:hypothetical protein [Rhodovarius sp.]MCX7932254.1 hypothetical protein [Rhodovarius sp.]MDW8315334.1 hypothetical protein [Rhodovarius sp.]